MNWDAKLLSPMSRWLAVRSCREAVLTVLPNGAGHCELKDDAAALYAAGAGDTVEEAMASALNALMARQGGPT